jgi:hypothetical protein
MSLQILKKDKIFYLHGIIDNLNYRSLVNYFEYNFNIGNNVAMNIDNLEDINEITLESIEISEENAIQYHKTFEVLGDKTKLENLIQVKNNLV